MEKLLHFGTNKIKIEKSEKLILESYYNMSYPKNTHNLELDRMFDYYGEIVMSFLTNAKTSYPNSFEVFDKKEQKKITDYISANTDNDYADDMKIFYNATKLSILILLKYEGKIIEKEKIKIFKVNNSNIHKADELILQGFLNISYTINNLEVEEVFNYYKKIISSFLSIENINFTKEIQEVEKNNRNKIKEYINNIGDKNKKNDMEIYYVTLKTCILILNKYKNSKEEV